MNYKEDYRKSEGFVTDVKRTNFFIKKMITYFISIRQIGLKHGCVHIFLYINESSCLNFVHFTRDTPINLYNQFNDKLKTANKKREIMEE